MLIGNYSVLAKNPGRSLGGGAIGLGLNRADFNKRGMARGAFTGEAWEPKSGIPDGYRPPYAWVLPQTAGGLAARNNLLGAGAFVGSVAGGVNGEASLAGAGDLSGIGALIVSLVAALTGSGTISSAAAVGYLNLAASLAGAGDIAASINALAFAAAALSGSGTAAATPRATGALAAEITVTGTALSTANVGAAVWAAIAAANNVAGTMGQALNAAGSAGDPWITTLPGAYTGAQAGAVLALLQKLLRNKRVTDPSTGQQTIYDDDGVTVLVQGDLFEDADATQPYRGLGAERAERLA